MSDMDVARVRAACEFADDADGNDSAALDRILAERDALAQRLADAEDALQGCRQTNGEMALEWTKVQQQVVTLSASNAAAEARAGRAEEALDALVIWSDGLPYFRTHRAVPMEMSPKQRRVLRALTPTEEPGP